MNGQSPGGFAIVRILLADRTYGRVQRCRSYPGSDLNRHWTVFETVASANWATGACSGRGYRVHRAVSVVAYRGAMSKRSITRKLSKVSARLTVLRDELRVIDEQMRYLDDDAEDMRTRATVAENTAASREAREAGEHVGAHRRQRERVVREIDELAQRQDSLLDELTAAN